MASARASVGLKSLAKEDVCNALLADDSALGDESIDFVDECVRFSDGNLWCVCCTMDVVVSSIDAAFSGSEIVPLPLSGLESALPTRRFAICSIDALLLLSLAAMVIFEILADANKGLALLLLREALLLTLTSALCDSVDLKNLEKEDLAKRGDGVLFGGGLPVVDDDDVYFWDPGIVEGAPEDFVGHSCCRDAPRDDLSESCDDFEGWLVSAFSSDVVLLSHSTVSRFGCPVSFHRQHDLGEYNHERFTLSLASLASDVHHRGECEREISQLQLESLQ
jgi:hypothetical protein